MNSNQFFGKEDFYCKIIKNYNYFQSTIISQRHTNGQTRTEYKNCNSVEKNKKTFYTEPDNSQRGGVHLIYECCPRRMQVTSHLV